MKIKEKISKLKKTLKEIKSISKNIENNNDFQTKIEELNKEILILKKGIAENIKELEDFLEEENARS